MVKSKNQAESRSCKAVPITEMVLRTGRTKYGLCFTKITLSGICVWDCRVLVRAWDQGI